MTQNVDTMVAWRLQQDGVLQYSTSPATPSEWVTPSNESIGADTPVVDELANVEAAYPAVDNEGRTVYTEDYGPAYSDGSSWLPFVGADFADNDYIEQDVSTPGQVSLVPLAEGFTELLAPATAWAARGTGAYVGQRKRMTDIGPTGGTIMMWNGTYWRVMAPTTIHFDITLYSAANLDTTEQIPVGGAQYAIPAGLLRAGLYSVWQLGWAKDGTNAALTGRLRIGTAGSTADAFVASLTSSVLATANRAGNIHTMLAPTSQTNLRALGSTLKNLNFNASGYTAAYPQDITVSSIDSALIATLTTQTTGSVDRGQVAQFIVTLVP